MRKKFVVATMIGMNRSSGRDASHPFDMSFFDGYNAHWMPNLDSNERKCSAPIYEIAKTMHEFVTEFNDSGHDKQIIKEDLFFIFGRGTMGSESEERLAEALLEARRCYGKEAFYIVYGKSFGAVDLLRTFREIDMRRFDIDLMFLIDGYASSISRKSVTKEYDIEGEMVRRFAIPQEIRRVYCVVQREKGFNGIKAGSKNDGRCKNKIIEQKEVDAVERYYDHYSDGYKRRLKVDHNNMDEIVAVIPCCAYGGSNYTVNDLIKKSCYKYME